MKIRIRGNSLRLRLQQSEVRQLADKGEVTEAIHFGPEQRLVYSLQARETAVKIEASYEPGRLSVVLPTTVAREWALSDAVSLVAEQPTGCLDSLNLLIEKDFTCINPRAIWQEDQTDNYPNPNPSCGTDHAH